MKRHHWLLLAGLIVIGIALFVTLLIITAPAAVAPTRTAPQNLDDATMNVARTLYCPVCPSTPLDVCDTQACQQWRALIRDKLAAGQTPEQIQQYFVAEYGQRVLGAPKPEGINLAIYIAPAVAILAGGVILYFAARRWMRARAAPVPAETANAYRERIERELKETDR